MAEFGSCAIKPQNLSLTPPTSPTVEVCLFADDAAILSQSHSPEAVRKNLQSYLGKLKKWLTLWRISVNTSKSQAIIFKKGNFQE
ncbi:hypothetical protein TNCV_733121 [Trichonephila clavipes]|nr:hypothetical protein TNCV_733121 [Trichonephila clavipes]